MTASNWLLALIIVVVAAGAVLLLLPVVQLSMRAKRDYRRARGTQHRQQIETALTAIRGKVGQLQRNVERLDHQLAVLADEESRELDQALARYLVSTNLVDVPGVGRTRAADISNRVFRSQLSDLHSAHQVHGIGPTTQAAISRWVDAMQSGWSQLLSVSFTGKQQILDRYSTQRHALERQRLIVVQDISTLQDLDQQATRELQKFSQVTVADFRRALRKPEDRKNAEHLQQYILGLFPPWGKVPSWYAELMSAAEGESVGGRVT